MPRTLALALAALWIGCARPRGHELFVHGAPLHAADAIVVLGNRPPTTAGGEVAPETDRRVRRGVALHREGLAPWLVLVGARDEEPVMVAHAERLGVSREAILSDGHSWDTANNAREALALLRARGLGTRVIVVSSPYHLRRARRLFECAGAVVQVAATPIPDDPLWQASMAAYEYAAGVAAHFADPCGRVSGSRSGSGPGAPAHRPTGRPRAAPGATRPR
ncbi:MAG: YdcF family protein [Sandaracinaceae bacterium]|nr:YdcF family protein [Sandaracinaceae bacterium]